MNTAQNLLLRARRRIEIGLNGHICPALWHSAETKADKLARGGLLTTIAVRLQGHRTLESWLRGVKHIDLGDRHIYSADTWAKLKATRLAWIDSLIEEFK